MSKGLSKSKSPIVGSVLTIIQTPKKQKDWFDFISELSKKRIYKIFKNGEEVFKYQLFWTGVSVEDIFEQKNGFDWQSSNWW